MVLAKVTRCHTSTRKQALMSRWEDAIWVGVAKKSNEHLVVRKGGGPAIRCRSVKRRPFASRWSAAKVAEIEASPRKPCLPRSDEWCSRRNAAANDAGTSKTKKATGEARLPLRLPRNRLEEEMEADFEDVQRLIDRDVRPRRARYMKRNTQMLKSRPFRRLRMQLPSHLRDQAGQLKPEVQPRSVQLNTPQSNFHQTLCVLR